MNARFARRLGLWLCAATLLSACAQQVGDIDRTQPNRIEKSALEGEWFFRQTVIDVNGSARASFIGYEGNAYRIVFDIEEGQLIARRVDEDIIGIDAGGTWGVEPTEQRGFNAVAGWGITSHFDVQRQYNASTGEQSNVISENSSDRPWYERAYIRVDWSRNMVDTDMDPLLPVQQMSALTVRPQDSGPDPTLRIERNEQGLVEYIDVVNEFVLTPDWLSCVLTFGFPMYDGWCGPETIRVRSSFMRILEESDYEPRTYSDFDMNRFGFFRVERGVHDDAYGVGDASRVLLIKRWNIWERHRDDDGNLIPKPDRTPKPIAFYLSENFPADLIGPSYEIAEQYSFAFRRTVAAAQGRSFDSVPRMFYVCLNPGGTDIPVPEGADELTAAAIQVSNEAYAAGICQRPGERKQLGDIRYSFFNWINKRQRSGPFGYGPSSADPRTGEIFNANANMYGQIVNLYAQWGLDMVEMMEGELDPVEYGYGEAVQRYFERLRRESGDDLFFGKSADGTIPREIRDTLYAMERSQMRADRFEHFMEHPFVQSLMVEGPSLLRKRHDRQGSRLPELRGTAIERMAILPELRRALAPEELFGDVVDGMDRMEVVSPVRFGTLEAFRRIHERRERDLLARNIHTASFVDNKLWSLVEQLREERQRLSATIDDPDELREALFILLRGQIYRAVQEHEVGHTVGLRHNFEGSTDAMNYHPQYWSLREELTFEDDCDNRGFRTFNPTGLGERLPDPRPCGPDTRPADVAAQQHAITMRELEGRGLWNYASSSIMDYGSTFNTTSGLGLYDYAAIAFGYGDVVEVFEPNARPHELQITARTNATGSSLTGDATLRRSGLRVQDTRMRSVDVYEQIRGAGRVVPMLGDRPWHFWHYSVLPVMFYGNVERPEAAVSDLNHAENTYGLYSRYFDFSGLEGMYSMYNRRLVPREVAEREGMIQVPFRFCSDEYRGSSMDCNLWDMGADEMEIFGNMRRDYENYYVMDMFRRGRAGWGLDLLPLINRMLSRYFIPALSHYQFSLLRYSNRGAVWGSMDFGGRNAYNVILEAVDFMAEALNTPTPGSYMWDETLEMYVNISDTMDTQLAARQNDLPPGTEVMTIGIEDGARYGQSMFRRDRSAPEGELGERGYYSYLEYETVTHFFTKYAALIALSRGSVNVLGADTSSDATSFYISPYLIFSDQMNRFLGSVITNDYRYSGWCARPMGNGQLDMRPITMLDSSLTPCQNGRIVNPHTAVFGNRDFNTPLLSIIYAAADFQDGFDFSWLDRSAIFIEGRGEAPSICPDPDDCGYETEVYVDTQNGLRYVAYYPTGVDPMLDPGNWRPGVQMVRRLNELEAELQLIEQTEGRTNAYFTTNNLLTRLRELVRLHLQTLHFYQDHNAQMDVLR